MPGFLYRVINKIDSFLYPNLRFVCEKYCEIRWSLWQAGIIFINVDNIYEFIRLHEYHKSDIFIYTFSNLSLSRSLGCLFARLPQHTMQTQYVLSLLMDLWKMISIIGGFLGVFFFSPVFSTLCQMDYLHCSNKSIFLTLHMVWSLPDIARKYMWKRAKKIYQNHIIFQVIETKWRLTSSSNVYAATHWGRNSSAEKAKKFFPFNTENRNGQIHT